MNYRDLEPEQAQRELQRDPTLRILDVRTEPEHRSHRLPNATLLPVQELAQRMHELDADANWLVHCEHGRRSLFACQPQAATVQAETAVLAYELDRRALSGLIQETPELIATLAQALARLAWSETHIDNQGIEPPPAVMERLIHLHRGQMEANYVQG